MDRGSSFSIESTFFSKHTPNLLLGTQPLNPILTRNNPCRVQLVADEPITKCRVVAMNVLRSVDEMSVRPFPIGDWVGPPLIERQPREAQYPAGRRDRNPHPGVLRS
jgi:hypothetical protein